MVRNFYYTVQLAYERTKAYTEHSSKKIELVTGWSGNGERFKEEMYMRHGTLFQQHHSRGEEMGKQISFPAKMQSYGQILFVRCQKQGRPQHSECS